MNAVEIKHLTFSYDGGKEVLSDLQFSVGRAESVGLIGANGAGKSTLLKILVGLLTGYKGLVEVGGLSVEKKHLRQVRAKTGYVFQDSESQLFLSTVYEDVAFGPRNYGYRAEEVERRVIGALRQVHIESLQDRLIYKMSGGEKKLASIATILSLTPKIVLLDEPSVALDPRNRKNLIQVIREIESTKIIASHDLDMIRDTCERTIFLSEGRIVKDGRTEEILTDEKLLAGNGLELPLSLSRRGGVLRH